MKIIIRNNFLITILCILIVSTMIECSKLENETEQTPKLIRELNSSYNNLKTNVGGEYFKKQFGDSEPKNQVYQSYKNNSSGSTQSSASNMETVNSNRQPTFEKQGYIVPKAPVRKPQVQLENPQFFQKMNQVGEAVEKRFETPMKMQNRSYDEQGFESPTFIHKNERNMSKTKSENNIHAPAEFIENTNINFKNEVEKDISTFIGQFDNAKDKTERIGVLLQGKNRLAAEARQLAIQVEDELKELLFAKEVAIKTNNLLANYEVKMQKDQKSQLKLADSITIKKILSDKIHRELQGFRTSKGEYKELDIINPADVMNIIHNIKMKLGQ